MQHALLLKLTSLLSREDFRMLYLSYVHSIMTYGIIYYEHMRELALWLLLFRRIYHIMYKNSVALVRERTRLPLLSSGQSFWLQIQRSRVRFPALPDFLSSSGSGTGSTQPREVN